MNSIKSLGGRRARESHKAPSLKAMARQLGVDPSEMGDKAEQVWTMLDDMAESDPEKCKGCCVLPSNALGAHTAR
jgi:hypothetical protein